MDYRGGCIGAGGGNRTLPGDSGFGNKTQECRNDTLTAITFDNIDAIAVARDTATALRVDVIPNLAPHERMRCEHLIAAIGSRQIFQRTVVGEVGVILEGTTSVEQFVADECHIDGGGTLFHDRRTVATDELVRALSFVLELHGLLLAVHDMMHAERALAELRQRL